MTGTPTITDRKAEAEFRITQLRQGGIAVFHDPTFMRWLARTLERLTALADASEPERNDP